MYSVSLQTLFDSIGIVISEFLEGENVIDLLFFEYRFLVFFFSSSGSFGSSTKLYI